MTQNAVDLGKLPIPTHALKDGGPYFDAAVVIAKDPETGVRNASIQRFMVSAKDRMNINIDAGRHLETYLDKAASEGRGAALHAQCRRRARACISPRRRRRRRRRSTPTSSASPACSRAAPLELVPSTQSDVEMIAHAMYALECEMVPGEVGEEGPFAEVTGYYAKRAPRPVVHVKAIHRRKAAGLPDHPLGRRGLELGRPARRGERAWRCSSARCRASGTFTSATAAAASITASSRMRPVRAGWSKQAIMATFAAFPPLKMVTVVDDDVDIRNPMDVEWAMTTRLDPSTGVITIPECFGHGLNPSFPNYQGTKIGFDCTRPFPYTADYDRAAYKEVSLDDYELARRTAA